MTSDLNTNLERVRERVALAAAESGRSPYDITLIAVTKTVSVALIQEALALGIRHFGENRVQEATSKFAAPEGDECYGGKVARDIVVLHMIGSLQRNKARSAASFFDVVHSIDRVELVEALEQSIARQAHDSGVALPVLIEVNMTGEVSKSGIPPQGVESLAEAVAKCKGLRGAGLMTIARMGAPEAEAREVFARLRRLRDALQASYPGDWTHLSMGMSDDYQHAIREGATMVRLGRALFGERKP